MIKLHIYISIYAYKHNYIFTVYYTLRTYYVVYINQLITIHICLYYIGKRMKKGWKRMITKVTFVGDSYTRKAPKYERFIRPTGLRFKKAHITHPELKTTFCLDILGVKKNPSSSLYTNLGVITKGTIIEVNVSELGLVTQAGKVVWGKYAQVTNNPELDGCINGVLLV